MEKGFPREPLKIVEICNAKYASQVLEKDVKISLTLPCPISVYVQGGKTHISTLLPTSIVHFFPNAGIEGVAAEVETVVQTNLLRRGLHPALKKLGQPKAGLHSLRRFRLTWLRKNRVPADLERFWMGHENETVGDDYSKLKDDVAFRLEQAETVGLGLEILKTADVVRIVRKNEVAVETESAA